MAAMQAGRSARRSGAGIRWIAAGVVITLFVLLIDASLNSRSPGAIQQISVGAWVDRVLPVITRSNAEGQELAAVWQNGLNSPPSADAATVSAVAAQSAADYHTAAGLAPPAGFGGAAGLLDAALLSREKAAGYIQAAFDQSLGAAANPPSTAPTASSTTAASTTTTTTTTVASTTTTTTTTPAQPPGPSPALAGLTNASSDLQLGDQAYQLFQQSLPASVGVKFPPSAWGADLAPYAMTAAQTFFATLQSKAVTTPVFQASILSITTDPAAVSTGPGGLATLPDASAITVNVVIADTGNQPESNLTVTAAITPANGASSVRDFVGLGVGQAYTVSGFGPLDPPQGVPVTLTVTVSGPSMNTATQSLTFQMPAPPPPSTTTTTGPATSTTTGPSTTTAG